MEMGRGRATRAWGLYFHVELPLAVTKGAPIRLPLALEVDGGEGKCRCVRAHVCVCVLGGMGGERGGMRRKRHQTRSKIINRLSAEH